MLKYKQYKNNLFIMNTQTQAGLDRNEARLGTRNAKEIAVAKEALPSELSAELMMLGDEIGNTPDHDTERFEESRFDALCRLGVAISRGEIQKNDPQLLALTRKSSTKDIKALMPYFDHEKTMDAFNFVGDRYTPEEKAAINAWRQNLDGDYIKPWGTTDAVSGWEEDIAKEALPPELYADIAQVKYEISEWYSPDSYEEEDGRPVESELRYDTLCRLSRAIFRGEVKKDDPRLLALTGESSTEEIEALLPSAKVKDVAVGVSGQVSETLAA